MTVVVYASAWVACGVAAAGFAFADFQSECPGFNLRQDLGVALLLGLTFGPFALVGVFLLSGFGEHGWRLR